MKTTILSPVAAAAAEGDDFIADFPLRHWGVVEKIRELARSGVCGSLSSLRFTWMRPKKLATDPETFFFRTLPWLIDAAWFVADSPLEMLHIEAVPGRNSLFALARFKNDVTAEFELNECLPDSMSATHFAKANYSEGHVSSQPLVGYFNTEGSVLADEESCRQVCVENIDLPTADNEVDLARIRFRVAAEREAVPAGPEHAKEILRAIREALKND